MQVNLSGEEQKADDAPTLCKACDETLLPREEKRGGKFEKGRIWNSWWAWGK